MEETKPRAPSRLGSQISVCMQTQDPQRQYAQWVCQKIVCPAVLWICTCFSFGSGCNKEIRKAPSLIIPEHKLTLIQDYGLNSHCLVYAKTLTYIRCEMAQVGVDWRWQAEAKVYILNRASKNLIDDVPSK